MKRVVALGHGVGMFSMFIAVLTLLDEFSENDVITYWNSNSLYWSPNGWNGSRNVWEYYFEPTSQTDIKSVIKGQFLVNELNYWNNNQWEYRDPIKPVSTVPELENMTVDILQSLVDPEKVYVTSGFGNGKGGWGGGGILDVNRLHLKRVIDRRIKIKPSILKQIDIFTNRYTAGKNVVGIHYRGTDKHTEFKNINEYDGKGLVPIDDYLKRLDRTDNHSLVYLATDSQAAFDTAQKHLGSRLLNQPNWVRSGGESSIHGLHSNLSNRAQHGEQAIIDWLLLSRCNYFIHGFSNLSAAVLFMAPELQHLNVYINRI